MSESPDKSLLGLTGIYLLILKSTIRLEYDGEAEDRIFDFERIAETIVLPSDPLAAFALAHVDRLLRLLHSVLNCHGALDGKMDCTTPITLSDLSFRDFLVDSALKNENEAWER